MIFDPYESHQLTGKQASLYRESLGTIIDVFRESRDEGECESIWSFGVTMIDELQWRQQLNLLVTVSKCVLNGSGDPDDWGALEKAAFYAVYRNIMLHLEIERDMNSMDASSIELVHSDDDLDLQDVDEGDEQEEEEEDEGELSWKEMIAGAYQEKCLQEGLAPEDIDDYVETDLVEEADDDDLDYWSDLLESLADQILEDRDFEMASTLMDADPEIVAVIKKELGIKPDYFLAMANEPSGDAVDRMFRELRELAGLASDGDEIAPF